MKKLNRRALSVMMIALFIILGLFTYIERFLRDGESWASYFSRLNSLSEGYVTDRNGVLLAAFTANDNSYNEDRNTRMRTATPALQTTMSPATSGTAPVAAFSRILPASCTATARSPA